LSSENTDSKGAGKKRILLFSVGMVFAMQLAGIGVAENETTLFA
jgi:hypothetical protein